jgi:C-terminal processing protease CtpA/Prc
MVYGVPVPPLALGVGGIAGSRKAAIAPFFAPRASASKKATAEGSSAIPVEQSHATTKATGFIFDPGPTGITMKEVPAGVIVADVIAGSQAFAQKVPLGGIILSVNGHPVYGLSWIGVNKAISKANWPMTLLIAPCTKCTFEGHTDRKGRVHITPVGFTLKDMQNGVIIDKVVPDTPASKQELPSGAFLVAVNDLAAVGMSSRDIGPLLKSRPLTIQTVPREVAYLFRPKGIFSNLRRKPRRLQQPAGNGPDDGSDVHRADCVL